MLLLQGVPRNVLQLVAVTCMMVASKQDEVGKWRHACWSHAWCILYTTADTHLGGMHGVRRMQVSGCLIQEGGQAMKRGHVCPGTLALAPLVLLTPNCYRLNAAASQVDVGPTRFAYTLVSWLYTVSRRVCLSSCALQHHLPVQHASPLTPSPTRPPRSPTPLWMSSLRLPPTRSRCAIKSPLDNTHQFGCSHQALLPLAYVLPCLFVPPNMPPRAGACVVCARTPFRKAHMRARMSRQP